MTRRPSLDELLTEAVERPIGGWDFGWLRQQGRFQESALPWDYDQLVRERLNASHDLLDLGTGGGERLAALQPHPSRTVATESYRPNVSVAARRLAPRGIQVIHCLGAPDNDRQQRLTSLPSLPFRDESFHLVIDRNEAFVAREVARILFSGGIFLTEQSGTSEIAPILRLLGLPVPPPRRPTWNLDLACRQAERADLRVLRSASSDFEMSFRDVGALVWYMRMAPWAVPGFSVYRHRSRLEHLHERIQREGPLRVPRSGFWLEAVKGGLA